MADSQVPPPTDNPGVAPTPSEVPQSAQASPQPVDTINVFNPDGDLVGIHPTQLSDALEQGYQEASPQEVQDYALQQKYGGAGQQAIAGLEGLGEGASFGLSAPAEVGLGLTTPEAIAGRAAANTATHMVGQGAGLVASTLVPGVGEAKLLGKAGQAGADALGLGKPGASFLNQVAADTVKGAFEGALFQGTSEEIPKAMSEDPSKFAESAIADVGLAAVMGGVFSGTLGAALRKAGLGKSVSEVAGAAATGEAPLSADHGPTGPQAAPLEAADALKQQGAFVSELDRPAVDAGDFKATVENSNTLKPAEKENILSSLGSLKEDAPQIKKAAENLGAPVMEGMISGSKWVQKAEDSLINGAPTYSGIKRAKMYEDGYNIATNAVHSVIGDEGSQYSKAELGNIMKDSITKQFEAENEPIARLYNQIKQVQDIIPLSEKSAPAIQGAIGDIQELRISPGSPEGRLAARVLDEVGKLKTVDDVKAYKSILNRSISPTASSGEKRMAAILSDKLTDLEHSSTERFAKKIITEGGAPAAEAPAGADVGGLGKFKAQMQEMADRSNAITQSIADRKVANKQYAAFIKKVGTLSEQLGKGRVYGVQDAIHFIKDLTPESVTQKLFAKNNSEFLSFFKKEFPEQFELMKQYQRGALLEAASSKETGKLSPKLLFNKVNAMEPELQKALFSKEELSKLKDAETYLRSFPKNFNPSGTAGQNAFRQFFEHPTGAAIANARDFAIDKFIKSVSTSPEVSGAVSLGKATADGLSAATKGIKAVLNPDKISMPASITPSVAAREKLKELVLAHVEDPSKVNSINDNNPVEDYKQPFAATSSRAISYLNSVRPKTAPMSPLDMPMKATPEQQALYNRALDIAQQPLSILKHISDGTLTPKDVLTLNSIYPSLYKHLAQKMTNEVMEQVSKGKSIPYKTRIGMSMFLATPLDSTLTPAGIQSAQSIFIPAPAPQSAAKAATEGSGLSKLSTTYKTPGQAAEGARASKKAE